LGQTTALGRPAYLLTYSTGRLPMALEQSEGQRSQVVLTIDTGTYALLDVAVLPEGAAEGTARHPVQATQFEILDSVPESRFFLASTPQVEQRDSVASIRFPFLDHDMLLSLDDAVRRAPAPLLAPQQLPDEHMRGLALAVNQDVASPVALLYEGEFQNVLVLPDGVSMSDVPAESIEEELSAGAFRYRIMRVSWLSGGLAAIVYRPDTPDQHLTMILNDELSTDAERRQRLQTLIESLVPVDTSTLPVLRRNFQSPREAAGGG
jgi:hypothetical protein